MTAGMQKSKPPARKILLGVVTGAHGIRGDVVLRTFTGVPEDIAAYGPLSDKEGGRRFKIRVVRVTPKGVVARIQGIEDRNGAEALRGTELYVDRGRLPEPEKAEFYHSDLIGLEARDKSGVTIGEVVNVMNFGAGDLLEVRMSGGKDTDLLPFSNACVPEVDIAAGYLVVVPPVMTGEPEPAGEEGDADDETT